MISMLGGTLIYSDHGREVVACQSIDLEIQTNEFVGILGPSGSGKSSLLYLLSGLKLPTSGQILLDGVDLASLNDAERSRIRLRDFGFVFQHPYLLGYLTALENVLIAHQSLGVQSAALDLLDQLGVRDKAHRLPHELSGGEKQRVCVARALIGNPRAIFADEPTASLDHQNGINVVDLLNRHRGQGALIMVTHDATMLDSATRIVRIAEGSLQCPTTTLPA